MDSSEIEKATVHVLTGIIEYVPHAVVSRTIVRRITGNITASSFDTGEELEERISPFDTYIQIIDGEAVVSISSTSYLLKPGNGIVIPAHAPHGIQANKQFKMLSTVIKSGYED
jgi:quercetin dioxygenase-like cupin family protein